MDWHKLQQTLFEIDPADPAEDLRKLKESAGATNEAVPTVDYVTESANVAEGSLSLDKDYSVADFAALAGVTLNESQKTGSAGQLKGKDSIKKNPAGTTKNPTRDKLVGEDFKTGWEKYNSLDLLKPEKDSASKSSTKTTEPSSKKPTKQDNTVGSAEWRKFLKQHTVQLQQIAADPEKKKRFDTWMSKWAESVEEAEVMKIKAPNTVKQRDPNWRDMDALRKSGAMGAHKDKKRDAKMGKTKHKKDYATESIKEMLYRKLNNSK